jgi:hypothetical protein
MSYSYTFKALKGTLEWEFFGSDLEFCSIPLSVILKYYGFVKKNFDGAVFGGATIIPLSLQTTGNKKKFKLGQIFLK